jgi:plastocyanin
MARMNLKNSSRLAVAALAALVLAAGQTSAATTSHAQKHPARPASHLVTINVDLDYKPHVRSSFGRLLGYSPTEVHVRMGDRIQFVNVDDEIHTATGMSYTGQSVPAHYRYNGDPTKQSGRYINASEWSSGNLRAHGGKSQIFIAKNVGHYFYGCSYHLSMGQIGVIVVGP